MTAPDLVCGPCGTELPPNAKSYNESAVPSYRARWTDSPPRLCHRLGPSDMPFEAKRFRHRVIAPHQLLVGDVVAAGAG